jgi:hypothetical protein
MWIVKGSLWGMLLFVFGTLLFFVLTFMKTRTNSAIGLKVISGLTIYNVWFWVALVACVSLGLAVEASRFRAN